jgi:uncharacterized RDD family membrane protein YckC
LSTMPSSSATLPSWKQEVNRRIAEHKNRKGISAVDQDASAEAQSNANSRAAAAASRVAARFAQAPSYSEMQAAEARSALRVAEAATRVALRAQVAAQVALNNLSVAEEYEVEAQDTEPGELPIESQPRQPWDNPASVYIEHEPVEVRWDSDLPRQSNILDQHALGRSSGFAEANGRYDAEEGSSAIEHIEAAQPIHANLIEFPRELVATRRMRPRLTDAHSGTLMDQYGQLSIFEVDPTTISIDPAMPAPEAHVPSWSSHEWPAIDLDERRSPQQEYRYEAIAAAAPSLHQAPFSRRLMATMVDVALILSVVCAMAACIAAELDHLPAMSASEIMAFVAVMVVGVLYETLFLLYAKCTPGMRYAELSLCTFDDEYPTREQLKVRLLATLLSLLPMGLGMLWAIFDEDNLSWHDRHSRTYLRRS